MRIGNLPPVWCVTASMVTFLGTTASAHAYLDPGTGSMMLQVAIAVLLGACFSLKIFWRQLWGFISGLFHRKRTQEDGSDER